MTARQELARLEAARAKLKTELQPQTGSTDEIERALYLADRATVGTYRRIALELAKEIDSTTTEGEEIKALRKVVEAQANRIAFDNIHIDEFEKEYTYTVIHDPGRLQTMAALDTAIAQAKKEAGCG